MEGFFKLISYYQTQSEPAYCGLATLAVVLNALSIDPGRKWKGKLKTRYFSLLIESPFSFGSSMGDLSCNPISLVVFTRAKMTMAFELVSKLYFCFSILYAYISQCFDFPFGHFNTMREVFHRALFSVWRTLLIESW